MLIASKVMVNVKKISSKLKQSSLFSHLINESAHSTNFQTDFVQLILKFVVQRKPNIFINLHAKQVKQSINHIKSKIRVSFPRVNPH